MISSFLSYDIDKMSDKTILMEVRSILVGLMLGYLLGDKDSDVDDYYFERTRSILNVIDERLLRL